MAKIRASDRAIAAIPKAELHQHVDGSIPVRTTWSLMKRHGLNPVTTLREMKRLLQLQPEDEGSLLSYLDKFHYPLWITQFYENIARGSPTTSSKRRTAAGSGRWNCVIPPRSTRSAG